MSIVGRLTFVCNTISIEMGMCGRAISYLGSTLQSCCFTKVHSYIGNDLQQIEETHGRALLRSQKVCEKLIVSPIRLVSQRYMYMQLGNPKYK